MPHIKKKSRFKIKNVHKYLLLYFGDFLISWIFDILVKYLQHLPLLRFLFFVFETL